MKKRILLLSTLAVLALGVISCDDKTSTSTSTSTSPSTSQKPSEIPSESTSTKPSTSDKTSESASTKPSTSEKPSEETSKPSTSTSTAPIVNKYKVNFYRGDEKVLESQEVNEGECATNPGAPATSDTKVFKYWMDENDVEFDFSTPITKETNLYAYFVFVVKYEAGGATGALPANEEYKTTKRITLPSCNLTKDGFTFAGWSDGTNKYMPGDLYLVSTSITFVATWTEAIPSTQYIVTFDANGGIGQVPASQSYESETSITLPSSSLTKDGFAFSGWNDGTSTYKAGATYVVNKSVTFIAVWSTVPTKGPKVTYKPGDHGKGNDIIDYANAEDYSIIIRNANTFEAEEGYVFDKWVKEGTSQSYETGSLQYFTSATTLVATWVQAGLGAYSSDQTAGLSFPNVSKDGSYSGAFFFGDGFDISFDYVVSGNTLTFTIAGVNYSCEFENYTIKSLIINYKGKAYNFGTTEIVNNPPVVNFSANGGSGIAPEVTPVESTIGGETKYRITLPANTYTAPDGKEFGGWLVNDETQPRKVGESYLADPNSEITIKAYWVSSANFVVETIDGVVTLKTCNLNEANIVIPEELGIQKISMKAFKSCNNVQTIDFPSTVTQLASGSLTISSLVSITLRSETEVSAIGAYNPMSLGASNKKLIVYVPSSLLTFDTDKNVYVYGSDDMGTDVYEFRAIQNGSDSGETSEYDAFTIEDILDKTFVNEDGFQANNKYTKFKAYYDSNFECNVLKLYYVKKTAWGTSNMSTTFTEFSYNNETHIMSYSNSSGATVQFGYKDGNIIIIAFSYGDATYDFEPTTFVESK